MKIPFFPHLSQQLVLWEGWGQLLQATNRQQLLGHMLSELHRVKFCHHTKFLPVEAPGWPQGSTHLSACSMAEAHKGSISLLEAGSSRTQPPSSTFPFAVGQGRQSCCRGAARLGMLTYRLQNLHPAPNATSASLSSRSIHARFNEDTAEKKSLKAMDQLFNLPAYLFPHREQSHECPPLIRTLIK